MCDVIDGSIPITLDSLKCITRKTEDSSYAFNHPLVLAQRIAYEANCPVAANCKFEYNIALTPKVTLTSSDPIVKSAGDTISFSGEKLGAGSLIINGLAVASDTADTGKVTFKMPALPYGTYSSFVKVGIIGYADCGDYAINIQSALTCTGVSPSEFS